MAQILCVKTNYMIEVSDLTNWEAVNGEDVLGNLNLTDRQDQDLLDIINLALDLKYQIGPFKTMDDVYRHNFNDVDEARELLLESTADYLTSINYHLNY